MKGWITTTSDKRRDIVFRRKDNDGRGALDGLDSQILLLAEE
jgi:hypothetical protein